MLSGLVEKGEKEEEKIVKEEKREEMGSGVGQGDGARA